MKKKAVAGIALGILSISGISFAWFGGDDWEPLDPSTYWDPFTIDWADTNDPGHYFYGDLANNGMQVKDETRKIKELSSLESFVSELLTRQQRVALEEQNTTPLSAGTFSAFASNMDTVGQTTNKIINGVSAVLSKDDGIFRETEHAMDPRYTYDTLAQMEYSEQVYKELIDASRLSEEDLEYRSKMLQDALGVSADAVGQLAATQADTLVKDIYVQELVRRNALLNNYLALLALRAKQEQDQKLLTQEKHYNTFGAKFRDPYNPEDDNSNYVKSKPKGFVHFE